MAQKGASEEFDYLSGKSDRSDGVDVFDEAGVPASETDFDYLLAQDNSQEHDGFDAFDENNWVEVVSLSSGPWYRSPQARTLLIASGTALSAIVVSIVLLVFRESSPGDDPMPIPSTTPVTTPMATATATATATSAIPPAPPPPPPPEPSTMERAPAVVRPTVRPRQTKEPEIGVTRTPETRQPISVAPQPRGPRN